METEKPLVYLDNAATTFPKPEPVYQAMDSFYRQYGGNAGRGANPLARKSAALVEETRMLLQDWLRAPEVIFSPSATIALNTAILGARLRPSDVVYVTPFEHNSVLRPLEHLRKTIGIELRVLPFDRVTFECKLDEVKKQFRLEPPAMLCVTQVSNVLGLIIPVDELSEISKQVNPDALVVVDGSQAAGLRLLEMSRIDALIWSGHKSLYGPYGVAGIAFGTNWRPNPLVYGGTGTISESLDMPLEGPSRFEAGSQNISAIAGLNAAVKWLEQTGRDVINMTTSKFTDQLFAALYDLPKISVYAPRNRDLIHGIVSFTIDVIKPQMIETALGAQRIAVRAGLHCSPFAHEWAGTKASGGTVRVSVSTFTDQHQLQAALVSIVSLTIT